MNLDLKHRKESNGMEVSYSSSAEGFIWNGWRYFWLGVDSYEILYY